MDGSPPRGRDARRALLIAAVLGLLVVVALASTGGVPEGRSGARRPSDQLLDTVLSLVAVFVLVGGVIMVVVLAFLRRDEQVVTATSGTRRRGLVSGLISAGILLAFVLAALRLSRANDGAQPGATTLPDVGDAASGGDEAAAPYDPEFAPWPVAIALGLIALGAIAVVLERRARRRAAGPPPPPVVEEALADVLDETLDDLRAERDPRAAVIAAYARMERVLAAAGLARQDAEAPEEYLARVVDGVDVGRRNAARLTALFTWARFSGHDVRPEMKGDAIDTLEAVRDELRAAAARREAEAAARPAEIAA